MNLDLSIRLAMYHGAIPSRPSRWHLMMKPHHKYLSNLLFHDMFTFLTSVGTLQRLHLIIDLCNQDKVFFDLHHNRCHTSL